MKVAKEGGKEHTEIGFLIFFDFSSYCQQASMVGLGLYKEIDPELSSSIK